MYNAFEGVTYNKPTDHLSIKNQNTVNETYVC